MRIGKAVESLRNALDMAIQSDLEPIEGNRPLEDDCDIFHFEQGWGSTALGFGGIGGQAASSAFTTVVIGPSYDACVYFAGKLAYKVKKPNSKLYDDVFSYRVLPRGENRKYERE